jgi:DNA-directed RNA polymerase subunit RPC12/RpoP
MKVCGYCGRENDARLATCFECGTQLPEFESTPQVKPTAAVVCPKCGEQDNYKPAIPLRGSFSVPAYLIGGLLGLLFFNASRKRRVQCNVCDAFFDIRSPYARVALVVFWILVLPTLLVFALLLISMLFHH